MVTTFHSPFKPLDAGNSVKRVVWFSEVGKEDIPLVGGKGANLGEMIRAGFPIPPGFIVTSHAFYEFIKFNGLEEEIYPLLDNLDVDDTAKLQQTADLIQKKIMEGKMPPDVSNAIQEAYRELSRRSTHGKKDVWVAVRSSATAEDLPNASFAGQQATFLFVRGEEDLLLHVKKCWASLFTARAIYYRTKQGFDHRKVGIAVVVQKMVNSEVSGVMFTAHPVDGSPKIIIEAAYGLGEAVVSGAVTPDEYIVDKETLTILEKNISEQTKMIVMKEGGGTREVPVPLEKRKEQKLPDRFILKLAEIGKKIEEHYGHPQDIEWAVEAGTIYIVQSRAITTIKKEFRKEEAKREGEVILKGLPASPGIATGPVKIVLELNDLPKVKEGDILVTTMTSPDMVPAMEKAAAIVTDEGGMTCHAAIVSRELGIPAVVGTGNATKVLKDGEIVTVDAYRGVIYKGRVETEEIKEKKQVEVIRSVVYPTATLVKVNVALPEAAERAARTGADGVGLLRAEHMITSTGRHPAWFLKNDRLEELTEAVKRGIKIVAEKFYPKPVWYRTFDARTDEFRHLLGGEEEPEEDNPMLGWHGIRRSLDQPELIMSEFEAIKELYREGFDNIGVMIPFTVSVEEYIRAKELARKVGLIPHKMAAFGIMVETPAAALTIEEYIDAGIDFLSFGTNDLTQLTLGVDRNNARVQKLFNEEHPAVLKLIEHVISVAKEYGVETSICGQAGSRPSMVRKLVRMGIDSVSANIDAVKIIREVVYREERKILLDAARRLK